MDNVKLVIIGAGIAGLGAVRYCIENGIQFEIFEKESRIGGLCRTESQDGFLFDYTGHLLHFRTAQFKDIVFSLMGDNLCSKKRSAWIYSKNVYTRYPFQANLFGLPHDVVIDCIYEYSRQHFSTAKKEAKNFAQWVQMHFGSAIAEHFMIPYNQKIYKRKLEELSPDCGGRFIPQSDLKLLLKGALFDQKEDLGYNAQFYYPLRGGIETLVMALGNKVPVHVKEKVEKIDLSRRILRTSLGRQVQFDSLISTSPVKELVDSIEGEIDSVRDCSSKLKYISVLNVNIGIKSDLQTKHWVYVPEEKYLFHRIGFVHNFSSAMVPSGGGSIYLEISYDPDAGIEKFTAVQRCIDEAQKMGLYSEGEILTVNVLDIPYGYVIFDHSKSECFQKIKSFLEGNSIYTAGRFGSWEYQSMEDSYLDGWNTAEKVITGKNVLI